MQPDRGSGARIAAVAIAVMVLAAACAPGPTATPLATGPSADPTASAGPSAAPSGGGDPTGLVWAVIPDPGAIAPLGYIEGSAIGAGGQGIVLTGDGTAWSADGASWQAVVSGPDGLPVAADERGFVAAGEGASWTSPDGRVWTMRPDPALDGLRVGRLVAVPGGFVAAGYRGDPSLDESQLVTLRSSDRGATWVTMTGDAAQDALFERPIAGLAGSDGVLVLIVDEADGNGRLLGWTSTDGTTWQAAPPATAIDGTVNDVAALPAGGFVAVGYAADEVQGMRAGTWVAPPDGRSWRAIAPLDPAARELRSVATAGDWVVVAADLADGGTGIWRSRDGIAWERAPDVPSLELAASLRIVAGPDRLVATAREFVPGYPQLAWTSPPLAPEPAPTGAWSGAPDLPAPSEHAPAAAVGDTVILFGAATLALGPGAVAWVERAPAPRSRRVATAAVAPDGTVWLLGGYGPDQDIEGTLAVGVYDPAADRWRAGPPLPTRYRAVDAAFTADGRLLLVGRGGSDASLDVLALPAGGSGWERIGAMPWRGWFTLAATGDAVYLYGVVTEGERTPKARLVRVDPDDASVEELAAPDLAVWAGALEALPDGRLVHACGYIAVSDSDWWRPLRRVDAYDPATDAWSYLTSGARPCRGAGVAVDASGGLWIVGGSPIGDDPRADPSAAAWLWRP